MFDPQGFPRRGAILHAEGVPLSELAASFGTPTYVYSASVIDAQLAGLRAGLGHLPHQICYAVKANANLALLGHLQAAGCGFDAVSGGELQRVLRIGGQMAQTILSGVGKTDAEIEQAVAAGVLYVAVESEAELWACAAIGLRRGAAVPVSVRVNPDVDAGTHPHIATGMAANKFGIPMATAPALLQAAQTRPGLRLLGITCHIGSQITDLAPFIDAAQRLVALVTQLRAAGIALTHVGLGGGLGIAYRAEDQPPSLAAYGAALAATLGRLGLRLVLEPGRILLGPAGLLLARVVRCKVNAERTFVLLDAGMNDLLRPALYDAYHGIAPVVRRAGDPVPVDVVGPVCETADTFARGRLLPPLEAGDLVAIATTGAYGAAMASHYNGRPRAAEVLCQGAQARAIRTREPVADLWRHEIYPN